MHLTSNLLCKIAGIVGLLFFNFSSVAQTLEWANKIGSGMSGGESNIVCDKDGNIFIAGEFNDTADFDPGPGIFNLMTPWSTNDGFVAKYGPDGEFIWAKQFASEGWLTCNSIAIGMSGSLYITGEFQDTADFDPGPGIYQLISAGSSDGFILKLDPSGNLTWVNRFGDVPEDSGFSIAVDNNENVYTTGAFRGTVDFDPGPSTFNLTSGGTSIYSNAFISKLNSSGNFVWAVQFRSIRKCRSYSIAVDPSGNVYTTGFFQESTDFDPGPNTFNLTTNASTQEIFICKLNPSGGLLWAHKFGTSAKNDSGFSLTLDNSGNVYTTGWFQGTVDFDPGPATFNLTSAGVGDGFVQKLDASGNFIWANRMGGSNWDYPRDLTTDAIGQVYVTGNFYFTSYFGNDSLVSNGALDSYITKLDTTGKFIWTIGFGSGTNEHGNSIILDSSGHIITAGRFAGTVDFDPDTGSYNLTANNGFEIYVLELSEDLPGSIIVPCQFRTFLEGPFDVDSMLMDNSLVQNGWAPLLEPFTNLINFNHVGSGGGEMILDSSVFNVTGPDAIVDWIFIELRSDTDSAHVVETRSALLQKDGDIVDVDGISLPVFELTAPGEYFIALRHRNHLGVMTLDPYILDTDTIMIDLTNISTESYGIEALKSIAGINIMWAGNVIDDDLLRYSGLENDRDAILVKIGGVIPTNVVAGYHSEDVNMDGLVKYSGTDNDRDPILMNIGGTVPSAVRLEQLP